MIKQIRLKGKEINYNLQYKKVKNINLRIKPDGTINVSAGRRVSQKIIEDFLISKSDFILNALEKYANKTIEPIIQYFSEDGICDAIKKICERVYPYYERLGVKYPQIRFRKMVSRWGSCNPSKGILTFNTNLMYAPRECVEYVVLHEFTHFLQANHSAAFYSELEKVCPCWKSCREKLKEVYTG